MGFIRTLSGFVCWVGFNIATACAQQSPQYSLFLLNPIVYSPAHTGSDNALVATGAYRKQWNELKGAPVSQHVNVHFPLTQFNVGLGLVLDNDEIGAHHTTKVGVLGAYTMDLSRKATLSGGLSVGFYQYALDGSVLRAPQGNYDDGTGLLDHNDDFIPQGVAKAGTFYVDAGLTLRIRDFEISTGVAPIYSGQINLQNLQIIPKSHLFLSAVLKWQVTEKIKAKTGILAKSDFIEHQAEISNFFSWKENILFGTSFRGFSPNSVDAVVLFGGMKLNPKTQLVYSFDLPVSPLKTTHRGSHELLLQYNWGKSLGKGKLPPVIYNPRFL